MKSCVVRLVIVLVSWVEDSDSQGVKADWCLMIVLVGLVIVLVGLIDEEDTQIAGKEKFHVESNIRQNIEVQVGISKQVSSNGGQEIEAEEYNDPEQRKTTDIKATKRASMKSGSLEIFHQASYLLPTEKEGEFSVSDMVWGKVRSHPWWPGHIFDPSDSSEKAMKHYKKDCYLVAYFGKVMEEWQFG